jgi:hypothetical protein
LGAGEERLPGPFPLPLQGLHRNVEIASRASCGHLLALRFLLLKFLLKLCHKYLLVGHAFTAFLKGVI